MIPIYFVGPYMFNKVQFIERSCFFNEESLLKVRSNTATGDSGEKGCPTKDGLLQTMLLDGQIIQKADLCTASSALGKTQCSKIYEQLGTMEISSSKIKLTEEIIPID